MAGNLLEQQAREKAGQGPEWAIYRWESIPEANGSMLTGAVAPPLLSGKRKGKPNFSKRDVATEKRVFITNAERDAYEARWEQETGKCARCEGKAQTLAGWSKAEGQTYRPCRACGGTGAAKVTEGAPA